MIATTPPPVDAPEFERLMMQFEPFERRPSIAVAVSGGRDSMALALLSRAWVKARGGQLVALIVDHGLRAESRTEAGTARTILAEHGIDGRILAWVGDKPQTGLQAAARHHRYRLLREECAHRGILHLLLAHQADDQVETVSMRAARGSGLEGLSGMAALVELPELRVLRPLLGVSRSRLTSTLRGRGVRWLDDPSNLDTRFERARLRIGPPLQTVRIDPVSRHDRERAVALTATALLEFDPSGAVTIDKAGFSRLEPDLQGRLLGRLVQALGGGDYPPRRERLSGACERLCRTAERGKSGRAQDFTLGGCRLMLRQVSQSRRLRWIVSPENGRNGGQPLFPAGFFAHFACGVPPATHLKCNSTPTDIGQ